MYELTLMRVKYILRRGSPEIKHMLLEELKRLRAEVEAATPPAEAAGVNEAEREAKKGGKP
jgi:hypothetical protein